ncbi:hypothetical protein [Lyngbya sp. CCY1209]|uniref:hypothetical protein n=1 Tax=Lyngbya sp. CCY1209 TaxID=2886103 RepID=UPI002D213801|nr:hypothetical protein [Lyngbya sp. CCY1209]MEB3884341.1 hypothetical protein [Lyngbya sp. CCY1209]
MVNRSIRGSIIAIRSDPKASPYSSSRIVKVQIFIFPIKHFVLTMLTGDIANDNAIARSGVGCHNTSFANFTKINPDEVRAGLNHASYLLNLFIIRQDHKSGI